MITSSIDLVTLTSTSSMSEPSFIDHFNASGFDETWSSPPWWVMLSARCLVQ